MNHIVVLESTQTAAFKIIFEALKDIIIDTNITYTEKGMKILTTNGALSVLVYLFLEGEKFEKYVCKENISVGVNLINFQKIIKTVTKQDIITFYIDGNDRSVLGIKINNEEKSKKVDCKFKLRDMNDETIVVPHADFDCIISMQSEELQKNIKDMINIDAKYVDIKAIDSELIFSCKGTFTDKTVTFTEGDDSSKPDSIKFIKKKTDGIVQGCFKLKFLSYFVKCTKLNNRVRLFFKNNFPIILEYRIGNMGTISLALNPRIKKKNST